MTTRHLKPNADSQELICVAKVLRTIADLEGKIDIASEAIHYRMFERTIWV